MFYEVDMLLNVGIPTDDLDENETVSQRFIITRLLKSLLCIKSTKDMGYFLAITSLKYISKGEEAHNSWKGIPFTVACTCRTFMPCPGEIMNGVVYRVHSLGVFLRCGPIGLIYLAARKMADYRYHPLKNPVFLNPGLSRIEVGVVVRFAVFAVRWVEQREDHSREFMVLASLEGDCLGPVSLTGTDELDL